jgi:5-methylcytosine-specific restriction endonuclease McrA
MDRGLVELVWERAGRRCEYCQVLQIHDPLLFEIDHIIARKHRGSDAAKNRCLACMACNNHKGPNISGVDSQSKKIVPLFNPRRHKWQRHFRWAGPVLVGLTPAGRATINVLEINLDYRIAFRQGLIDEGVFPPT